MEGKFLIVANIKINPLPKYDFSPPKNLEVAVAPQTREIYKVKDGFVRAAQHANENIQELKDLGVKYCLVGHSYYRNNFGETNENAIDQISKLESVGIIPILCARNLTEIPSQARNDNKVIVMYEPEEAISTNGIYHPESPEKINKILATFPKNSKLLYGGSVNQSDCSLFITHCPLVRGFVVGHASLDPNSFSAILNACSLFV